MKKCPYCAEEIQEAAIYCRFCKRDLPPLTLQDSDKGGIDLNQSTNLPKAHKSKQLLWIIPIVLIIIVVILVTQLSPPKETVILSCNPYCEVWSTPGHFSLLGRLPDNTVAIIIEKDVFGGNQFYHIKAEGLQGWISEYDIKRK